MKLKSPPLHVYATPSAKLIDAAGGLSWICHDFAPDIIQKLKLPEDREFVLCLSTTRPHHKPYIRIQFWKSVNTVVWSCELLETKREVLLSRTERFLNPHITSNEPQTFFLSME